MGLDRTWTWVRVADAEMAARVLDHFRGGRRSNEDRPGSGFVIVWRGECVVDGGDNGAEEASTVGLEAFCVGVKEGEYFVYERWRGGVLLRALTVTTSVERAIGEREPWEPVADTSPTQWWTAALAHHALPR